MTTTLQKMGPKIRAHSPPPRPIAAPDKIFHQVVGWVQQHNLFLFFTHCALTGTTRFRMQLPPRRPSQNADGLV